MGKILVVDDSESIRELLKNIIEQNNKEVITAENGQDALDKLDGEVNLILCDLHMPVMNGIEFAKHVRNNQNFKYIPIIMLTTENSIEQKKLAKDAGVTGWLTKPINPEKLLQVINLMQ